MKSVRWWFVGLAVCVAPGCLLMAEGGVEDEPRLEQVPLEQGYTGCGDPDDPDDRYSVCHPNQHCLSYKMGWCTNGCLSNDNCAAEQRCVKSDDKDRGTCQNSKRPTDDPREPDNRNGLTLCGTNDGVRTTCELGYFCADPGAALCEPGCLSDANCGYEQGCEKAPGEHVGVCTRL